MFWMDGGQRQPVLISFIIRPPLPHSVRHSDTHSGDGLLLGFARYSSSRVVSVCTVAAAALREPALSVPPSTPKNADAFSISELQAVYERAYSVHGVGGGGGGVVNRGWCETKIKE